MRRHVIGFLAGMGVTLGTAAAAEAQGIKITGTEPTQVYHNQSQSTYSATLQWTGPLTFKLWVYYDSVLKYQSQPCQYSVPGTLQISHPVTGMSSWGMQAGHPLKYRGKVWYGLTQNTHDLFVTVSQGTSKLIPRKETPAAPYREELLAEAPRREEREWA